MRYQVKPEPALLTFVSSWEAVALTTGTIPSWTSVVRPLPLWARFLVALGCSGFVFVHFHVLRDLLAAFSRD